DSMGIDMDPLARLIAQVKTTVIETPLHETAVNEMNRTLNFTRHSGVPPTIPNLTPWFTENTIADLGVARDAIEAWKNRDPRVYNFLIICLSSIIRKASNADNQSLKTYVSHTYKKQHVAVNDLFLKALHNYASR